MARAKPARRAADPREDFLDMSVALTGFDRVDLEGTGVAGRYYDKAEAEAGRALHELLATWRKQVARAPDVPTALRRHVLADADLGPLARQILRMWYLGAWQVAPGDEPPVSAETYVQGLVWDAIGAHPQAAKQQGFGAWSFPPPPLREGA